MELAYLDENTRELELVKHVSLAQIAPLALVALTHSGRCTVQLPESEKQYDRNSAMETLKAIVSLGYRIEKEG